MSLLRHIALFLALAIGTIAVTLMPSSAQAHDGYASAVPHTHAAPAQVARDATVTGQAEARIDCTGPCCTANGHHGSSCCATGLVPASDAAALPPLAPARSLSREQTSPDGIVPEALPEPPRPFA